MEKLLSESVKNNIESSFMHTVKTPTTRMNEENGSRNSGQFLTDSSAKKRRESKIPKPNFSKKRSMGLINSTNGTSERDENTNPSMKQLSMMQSCELSMNFLDDLKSLQK